MLLSPEQFSRLSEYAAYSRRKLKDMLSDFQQDGKFYSYLSVDGQTINIDGFRAFLIDYFGADLPSDLVDQLFLSFSKPPIKERRTSLFEDAISTVRAKFSESLSGRMAGLNIAGGSGQQTDRSQSSEPQALVCIPEDDVMGPRVANNDSQEPRIPLKPLICTLSLLEADTPENKLDVVFHVYDSDGNGFLDKSEIDGIIEQMMNVARYQQWDTIELEQVIRQMMVDIDYDNDGIVSFDEWRRGGLTNIPLLVLLGFDTEMKEDGSHVWRLRHFTKPTYCNACCSILVGWGGKQGLSCSLCKYTVHERCVRSAATNCIRTYSSRQQDKLYHHWQDANATAKCVKCKATVGVFQGKGCRWCHNYVHHRCMSALAQECDLGALVHHILPPTHIFPAFLERKTSTSLKNHNFSSHSASLLQAVSPSNDCRPLLVLVNPKSGGKQGVKILQKFEYLLNPRQVYDLSKTGPEPGLQLFSTLKNCNILVCGGDGTIGWVLESMDKMTFPHGRPPVAVLPLGTGNDLARCLRWGGGYENENLHKILEQIEKSSLIDMDRWQIKIEITENKSARRASEKGDTPPYSIINNYFSIGVDASIAHRFHVMREKFPEKFNSRMRNKLWYFELGTSETLSSSCKNLHEQIDILCDGESIDLGQDASLEGIALLNIPSIYGGSNLWGRSRKSKGRMPGLFPMKNAEKMQLQTRVQDIGDGLIELVGLESAMQMGQIKAGVRGARRLSQCSTVVIQTHKSFPMQIDGEPWMQPPCIIQITHKNQAKMLVAAAPRKRSSWMLLKRQSTNDDN
ncbi:putative diacylglycerol kinase 3 [Caenorhabditis elegans]|uniref:Probable diacylglycerol kinase 3 n=1 Tax=Caenorhabditis elegans TaxID=6239 RepID=DGK3_CAEEL|nr:putative diacylglycerol kinase 3 [Caenorhabditis elegans]Q03603.3 RecName: Full=Probable diacylglycerol kinase 3; Short=DAG kinase 3; AltName: Full=Diglyceride kinase 3; Short=DGK-3 [Caenorhabditis elegans]CAA79558.3 Probable diacylglycerol kinase 3 [Caenorhabditis elegans]|eukprot:NP_499031.3 Probable diacylglycerol kinase 3 [Caenorhabditis elegans]